MTHPMTMKELAERGLGSARLMRSGRYRIPWSTGQDTVDAMLKAGFLSDDSGYLTPTGLAALRASQEPTQ